MSKPLSPQEQLTAHDEQIANLQSEITDLTSQIAAYDAQLKGITDGQTEANGKVDQILNLLTAKAPAPDPTKEPEAPKASVEPVLPEAKAIEPMPTAAEIAQAVTDALSGAGLDTIKSEVQELKAAQREISGTKVPDKVDDVTSSAKVGDEDSTTEKAPSYRDVFKADKDINPKAYAFGEEPRDQTGVAIVRAFVAKYGTETQYNNANGLAESNAAPQGVRLRQRTLEPLPSKD